MCVDDPRLAALCKARNNRRSHSGDRWRRILPIFVMAMQEGWCDLDLLLDPFFLHFPKRSDEGEHQSLSVVIPVGLIHLSDICPNTPNDCLYRPFLLSIRLWTISECSTLSAT
ncbi:hypothetical protein PHMEG_00034010 [Phytophthora megakarya]|uniref:Uncharacterized protein n=1 Tax=Phytophthora megakarya TaxID=4795 RepID=A0A225USJ2_9STRA|nr:hypothetical protein PHMEG_00034010 [Phytophthora megakarya]